MKNKRDKGLLAKALTGFLAVMLVIGGIYLAGADVKYVQAETDQGTVVVLEDTTIDYKVKQYTDISNYRTKDANGNFTAPTLTSDELIAANDATKGEWLFAGWFTDKDCTKALSSGTVFTDTAIEGTYYAKFVSADVLSVKCQVGADIMENPDYTVLRCISTVDSLAYRGIGLRLVKPDGTVRKMDNNKVNTRIQAREVSEGVVADAYSYSPKVVDTESEYFFSATEVIAAADFDKEYIVKPYWITKDGTTVWGVSRCVTVNEAINKNTTYVPVKMTTAPAENATLTANDGTTDHTLTYSGKYDADTGYAHFKLTTDLSSLKSLTNYTITGSDVNASYAYRNLNTKVTGITTGIPTSANGTDQSWYTVANANNEDEFIIATDADFYGLAEIVNTTEESFADETIYLVSDITMNKGYANPSAGSSAWSTSLAEDGKTSITDGTNRSWNAIGSKSDAFAGVFDGQMHSISGIYMESGVSGSGLFGGTITTAKLRNFRLENSFFKFTKPSGNGAYQSGSIVGFGLGELDTIYSNAVIRPGINYAGGMVGTAGDGGSLSIKNCWFDGNILVYQAASYVGGFVGLAQAGGTTIENCLNTAAITNEQAGTPGVGGLVGYVNQGANIMTISNCLNMGQLKYSTTKMSTHAYGLLVGYATKEQQISVYNSYSTTQDGWPLVANKDQSDTTNAVIENSTVIGAETDVAGEKALTSAMTSLFTTTTTEGTTESYWAIVPGHGPALASFAETVYGSAQSVDTSWKDAAGTESNPYLIADMADFYGLAMLSKTKNFAGEYIKLTSDISTKNTGDASTWETTSQAYEWIGIGDSTYVFAGKFDGQGHEISGIYISSMSGDNQGLFRTVGVGAEIKNFSLINSYMYSSNAYLGSMAGTVAGGEFDSLLSDAIVKTTSHSIGGFIGQVAGGATMNNCWFKGSVTNNSSTCTGGLVGRFKDGTNNATITNCLNSGEVSSTQTNPYLGGLIGYKQSGTATIRYCLNTGTLNVPNATLGARLIVGSGNYSIQEVYTVTHSTVMSETVTSGTVTGEFAADTLYGTSAIDKLSTLFEPKSVDGEYVTYWAVTETTPVLSTFAEYATDAFGNSISAIAIDTSWYDANKNSYALKDEGDFYGFALLSNKVADLDGFAGKTVKLGADITIPNAGEVEDWPTSAPSYSWTSIGNSTIPFKGTFNGQGYEISGIYLKGNGANQGMFGYVGNAETTATIMNFSLVDSYLSNSSNSLGSIAGYVAAGTFESIYSNAIVEGLSIAANSYAVGGFIGQGNGAVTMNKCWFDGSVTNNYSTQTAGLIGRFSKSGQKLTVTNCLNSGAICSMNTTEPYMGGLVGYLMENQTLDISYSLNAGKVTYDETIQNQEATLKYAALIGWAGNASVINVLGDTYATQNSCERSYGQNSTGTLTKENTRIGFIVDTAINGHAAKDTALFATANPGAWVTVPNSYPILADFADKREGNGTTEGTMSTLHTAIANAKVNSTYVSATTNGNRTLSGGSEHVQGGCTDGEFYYHVYLKYNLFTQDGNNAYIVRYRLSDGEIDKTSDVLTLYHANDMTYNSKIDRLIVSHASGNERGLSIVNPDTLKVEEVKSDIGFAFHGIDYNAANDCYVVYTGSTHYGYILNADFEPIITYNSKADYVYPDVSGDLSPQGVGCDDKYIYYLYAWTGEGATHNQIISVLDWNGNHITNIRFGLGEEAETIIFIDGKLYVNVLQGSSETKLYELVLQ